MATNSSIEWTDASWNPTVGCRKVSPGCLNCYAETMSHRLAMMAKADKDAGRDPGGKAPYMQVVKWKDGIALPQWNANVVPLPDALDLPLSWRKPRRVFVNSMSDLFYGDEADRRSCASQGVPFTPVPFEFIDRVFAVMGLAPQHTFQILTKRPERMAEYLNGLPARMMAWDKGEGETEEFLIITLHDADESVGVVFEKCSEWLNTFNARNLGWPLPNVWLGTSVENQAAADERLPHLLRCPAAVRFLSCEPLLGPLYLSRWLVPVPGRDIDIDGEAWRGGNQWNPLGWLIAGGESGAGARACSIDWIRSIVGQCKAAGVPCFVKQLGSKIELRNDSFSEWPRDGDGLLRPATYEPSYQGELVEVRTVDRKGGEISEFPEDLRIRQFPKQKGSV